MISALLYVVSIWPPRVVHILYGSQVSTFLWTGIQTWYDSVDGPQLIAAAPPGCQSSIALGRRLADENNHEPRRTLVSSHMRPVCMRTRYRCSADMEVLAVYVCGARRNALVIVISIICRPGSIAPTNDDVIDVCERASIYACLPSHAARHHRSTLRHC